MRVFSAFLLLIVAAGASPSRGGELDLGEVFIWGQDRSVLPGLEEEGLFLYPHLSKSAFLPPLAPGFTGKSLPDAGLFPCGGRLLLRGGAGSPGGYILDISQSRFSTPGGYYYWQAGGKQDNIDGYSGDLSRVSIRAGAGRAGSALDWESAASWDASSHFFDRTAWKAGGGILGEGPGFTASAEGFASGVNADTSGYSAAVTLEGSGVFFYRHRLIAEIEAGRTGMDDESRNWMRPYLTYVNTTFSGFSFEAGAGGGSGGRYCWHFSVSGELPRVGFRLFALREEREPELYPFFESFRLLSPGDLFDAPVRSAWGGRVSGNIYCTELSAAADFESVDGHLTFIKDGRRYRPVNLPGNTILQEVRISAGRGPAELTASFPAGGDRVPDRPSSVEGRVFFSPFLPEMEAELRIEHTGSTRRWLNPEGTLTEKYPSSVSAGIDFRYPLTDTMKIRIGGSNLFSSSVRKPASFTETTSRYYMILEAGFN